MSRSGRDPGERLKTAKKRTASSARWLTRQINDPYVKRAKDEGYRSRAAFKLAELDDRFALLTNVTLFQMDFMADEAPAVLTEALGRAPDLVLSDMAANTVGHKQTDHLRTMGLVEAAADFAIKALAPGGAFVAKVLAGGTDPVLLALLKRHFTLVKHAKPPASRKGSSEWYVIAQGFKGG
jgi:23S rRNA (uridine2552-2'-O)-methyltransferase